MFKKLFDNICDIDIHIIKIMMKGFKSSLVICIIALLVLVFYNTYPISHLIYDSGIILFKTGLMFFVEFFICAFAVDTIKKQIQ